MDTCSAKKAKAKTTSAKEAHTSTRSKKHHNSSPEAMGKKSKTSTPDSESKELTDPEESEPEVLEVDDDKEQPDGGDDQTQEPSRAEDDELTIPEKTTTKVELTSDLKTIFSLNITVIFKKGWTSTPEKGWWCKLYRESKKKKQKGGNCAEKNIDEKKECIPVKILKERKHAAEGAKKVLKQATLDGITQKPRH
ncbi:hypothetical protein JAAARDRAFT_191694 [Jaapia argillacea MUCL 33604]|uniref:Uncharacterized protein n=1 Tax=Jaapia argillacea MUCL 33604 TaxID=933084 RepID=A0A067Q9V5_9AGAM|nr:hypothetical protein JAAARDRAFT_191694 [Jaapia argillacea MUCL 33604]